MANVFQACLEPFLNSLDSVGNPLNLDRAGIARANPFYAPGWSNGYRDTVVAAGLACKDDRHSEPWDLCFCTPVPAPIA